MRSHLFTLTAALVSLLVVEAGAQSGAAKGKEKSADGVGRGSQTRGPGTDVEIRIIRDYYSVQGRKQKSLPPGIARNLARGKPLPPGIARTRVPDDLLVLLPARSGTRWLIAGDVVLLVDAGDIIVDLVRLIF